MHELSLCQDMLEQVTAIAASHHAESVARVVVWVGPLSGVEPLLLQSAFDLIREGTVAGQADLVLETRAITVACQTCMAESDATVNNLTCRHCGSSDTRLMSGDELILAQVELAGVP